MSPRSNASAKRSTISRSLRSPSARRVACWLWSGGARRRQPGHAAVRRSRTGRWSRAPPRPPCREAEHIAQDERRPLARRQVLQGRDERQLERLAALEASLGARRPVCDPDRLIGVGLDPQLLRQRPFRLADLGWRRRTVVDRQHALGALGDSVEADVGRDPVEPGSPALLPWNRGKARQARSSASEARRRRRGPSPASGSSGMQLGAVRLDQLPKATSSPRGCRGASRFDAPDNIHPGLDRSRRADCARRSVPAATSVKPGR